MKLDFDLLAPAPANSDQFSGLREWLTKASQELMALTTTQKRILGQAFEKNPFPDPATRKKLAKQTGILESRILDTLQELVELMYQQATSNQNFSYMEARLCNYLSHHLTISPPSGNFCQLLPQRCWTEYDVKDQAAKGDEVTRKRFHVFVLFLGELYLNLEIKGTNGQVTRANILQVGLHELLNALFSNPMDDNLICAVKLLKLTVLEDAWKEKLKTDMEEIIQRIENVVLNANCSTDVKQMLLKLVELWSSNWADPDCQEKYQELLEREEFFPYYEENGTDLSGAGDPYLDDIDDEMDPEIEEAYEKFCLESEHKRKQ
ncbi:Polyadenylate-binding protein-interacting protein 1 [Heterocephalus glaber]|uniref:Polyadenylate-binding protein-interacting protein 1 n=1 Tax=Heterocephalus glaber TaxID=10181 RepID=G5B5Y8_HETGA|nr:Polyadenylate-binding protein-interacting protein 1 [Heterocephalus glaber]